MYFIPADVGEDNDDDADDDRFGDSRDVERLEPVVESVTGPSDHKAGDSCEDEQLLETPRPDAFGIYVPRAEEVPSGPSASAASRVDEPTATAAEAVTPANPMSGATEPPPPLAEAASPPLGLPPLSTRPGSRQHVIPPLSEVRRLVFSSGRTASPPSPFSSSFDSSSNEGGSGGQEQQQQQRRRRHRHRGGRGWSSRPPQPPPPSAPNTAGDRPSQRRQEGPKTTGTAAGDGDGESGSSVGMGRPPTPSSAGSASRRETTTPAQAQAQAQAQAPASSTSSRSRRRPVRPPTPGSSSQKRGQFFAPRSGVAPPPPAQQQLQQQQEQVVLLSSSSSAQGRGIGGVVVLGGGGISVTGCHRRGSSEGSREGKGLPVAAAAARGGLIQTSAASPAEGGGGSAEETSDGGGVRAEGGDTAGAAEESSTGRVSGSEHTSQGEERIGWRCTYGSTRTVVEKFLLAVLDHLALIPAELNLPLTPLVSRLAGSTSSQTRLHRSARPESEVVGEPPDWPQGSLVPAERGGPFDDRVGDEGEGEGNRSSIRARQGVREETERAKVAGEQRSPRPEQLSRNGERASNGGIGAGRRGAVSMSRSIKERFPRPRQILEALQEELELQNPGLTAQSKPIILAEVLPAVAVTSLALCTLAVYAVGIALVLTGMLRGSSTLSVPWAYEDGSSISISSGSAYGAGNVCGSDATSAAAAGPDPSGAASASGCTDLSPSAESLLSYSSSSSSSSLAAATEQQRARYGAVFSGDFAGLTGLYGSVSLRAAFTDEATLGLVDALPEPVVVDVTVEACTAGAAGAWGECEGGWQPVLFQEDVAVSSGVGLPSSDRGYEIFNFRQNQETVRGEAIIHQYRVLVGFVSTTSSTSTSSEVDFSGLTTARWTLTYETRGAGRGSGVAVACALGLWVAGCLWWCHAVFRRQGGFEDGGPQFEHKCLAFVGLSVALYLVGNLRGAPGSASWGLASEMLRSLAAAVFLVAALCMADGISRRGVDDRFTIAIARFYAPKVALGVAALMFMLLVDLALFPSLAGWDHGSLVAMNNWPHAQQVAFALVAVAEMALMAMWGVWTMWRITSAGRLLRQLPYVPTRFQQLSYTFFGLQVTEMERRSGLVGRKRSPCYRA
ncbi:unnamed protein product [Ectocarpus sp. CCAP 1310/34]|nr:unnamed protein product [Ectocarpus sp. CCAP 1310/34]